MPAPTLAHSQSFSVKGCYIPLLSRPEAEEAVRRAFSSRAGFDSAVILNDGVGTLPLPDPVTLLGSLLVVMSTRRTRTSEALSRNPEVRRAQMYQFFAGLLHVQAWPMGTHSTADVMLSRLVAATTDTRATYVVVPEAGQGQLQFLLARTHRAQ